jgi:hypothetical protein
MKQSQRLRQGGQTCSFHAQLGLCMYLASASSLQQEHFDLLLQIMSFIPKWVVVMGLSVKPLPLAEFLAERAQGPSWVNESWILKKETRTNERQKGYTPVRYVMRQCLLLDPWPFPCEVSQQVLGTSELFYNFQ